jgi:chorismate mutase
MKKTLEDLRKEIDAIDKELLHILSKRFAVVEEIGKLKKEKNIPALDENRWQEVLSTILEKARKTGLSKDFVTKIYEEIHQEALKIERKDE